MASKTSVYQLSLACIGGTIISSPSDGSKEAILLNAMWDDRVREVIEAHPWTFAREIKALALLTSTPLLHWDYVYALPSDFLKDLHVGDIKNDVKYEIVGTQLHTDEEDAVLVYTKECTNPGLWSAACVSAVAYRLAMDLSVPLLGKRGKLVRDSMREAYLTTLLEAETVDSGKGNNPDKAPPTRWSRARL
jgi:hypothetical protein